MTTPYVDLNTLFTPSSGGNPTVAYMTAIRSNQETLAKPPGCSVQRTTALSVVTATTTAIPFTAADLRDTDAFHDTTTNNTRLVIPTGLGGLYAGVFTVAFALNATGYRFVFWRLNGTTNLDNVAYPAVSTNATANLQVTLTDRLLSAGDYLECCVQQTSGGNLNTDISNFATSASLRMVGVS